MLCTVQCRPASACARNSPPRGCTLKKQDKTRQDLHIFLLKPLAPSKKTLTSYFPRASREGLAYAHVLTSISFVWIVASLCRQGKLINGKSTTTYIEIDQVGQDYPHPRTFWFLLVDKTTGASM